MRSSALRALRVAQQPMAVRAISSSASSSFAQPAEAATPAAGKEPKVKEFKIYRWVSMGRSGPVAMRLDAYCLKQHVACAPASSTSRVFNTRTQYVGLCLRQNPDTPQEKPKLESYKVDLNQCGPMMLDALVSHRPTPWSWFPESPIRIVLTDTDQDQERTGPHSYFPPFVP